MITQEEYEELNIICGNIIGAAIDVHRELGPGLLESAYEACLIYELKSRKLNVKSQVELPLMYKGVDTGKTYRLDVLVEDKIIVELKAIEDLKPVHEVQLVTYLKLTGKKIGLLINFNVPILKNGIKRKINGRIEYTGLTAIRE